MIDIQNSQKISINSQSIGYLYLQNNPNLSLKLNTKISELHSTNNEEISISGLFEINTFESITTDKIVIQDSHGSINFGSINFDSQDPIPSLIVENSTLNLLSENIIDSLNINNSNLTSTGLITNTFIAKHSNLDLHLETISSLISNSIITDSVFPEKILILIIIK